jgi:hypothetical protein
MLSVSATAVRSGQLTERWSVDTAKGKLDQQQRRALHEILKVPSKQQNHFDLGLNARYCTGFCTDCLHPGLTGGYWPLRGMLAQVIEAKGRRFIIRSL